MTDRELTDEQRKQLYGSMLRGVAKVAQDQLCVADQQHDWGEWRRYQVHHDDQDAPLTFDPSPVIQDRVFHTRAERKCLNCGKEQSA